MLLLVVVVPSQPFTGLASYLPLHTGLEILSIAISLLIFGVVWSLRNESLPRNVSLLAYAFLGVGLLDFTHMLYQDDYHPQLTRKSHFLLAVRAAAVGSGALLIVAPALGRTHIAYAPVGLAGRCAGAGAGTAPAVVHHP